ARREPPRTVDVRVVSATNRDLAERVASGDFREDLLYRLNLIAIELPPLRQRPADIPLLARRFAAEISGRYGRRLDLAPDVGPWLKEKPWPGSVRQLRHVLERAALVSGKETLSAVDFAAALQTGAPTPSRNPCCRTWAR